MHGLLREANYDKADEPSSMIRDMVAEAARQADRRLRAIWMTKSRSKTCTDISVTRKMAKHALLVDIARVLISTCVASQFRSAYGSSS